MTNLKEEQEVIDFTKRAKERFEGNNKMFTFGDIKPGELFAMRWGVCDDCILVFRIDEDFCIRSFQNEIKSEE